MREATDRLLGRLLIVAAVLAGASLVARYGFYLPQVYIGYLNGLDVGIISFFIAENFLRLLISREKLAYLRSHWLDFTFIGLFSAQIISLRFFSESEMVAIFLARLSIVSLTKAYIVAVQVYIGAALFTKTVDANRVIARLNLSASQLVLLSFAFAISIGTLLLLLPRATTTGISMPFIDALFTAASATCVTGLIVVDTGTYFSRFGQGIILFLIQLGGIGIMSLVAFSAVVMGRGIGMRQRAVMKDILSSDLIGEVTGLLRNIVLITGLCELAGVLILSRLWARDFASPFTTFYYSLFHSISAFCNAGFSLFMDSLEGFAGRVDVIMVFIVLIVIGGLGFTVVSNLASCLVSIAKRRRAGPRLSLHSRMVLVATGILLSFGTLAFYLFEANKSIASMPAAQRMLSAFFTSVTARTAGFSTTTMGAIATPGALIVILLMFIGASPGGTGGGIKTSTIAVMVATIRSILRGRPSVEVFKRAIPQDVVNKAICVVILSLGLILISVIIISVAEEQPLTEVLFESVSAFGTVGLSRGLTRDLTTTSKIVIILTMFFGRIGPLTLGLAIRQRMRDSSYSYPAERVMIG
ncbi:MAG: potassium transporter TrkG [Candidatus Eisenbacteria bacterium]